MASTDDPLVRGVESDLETTPSGSGYADPAYTSALAEFGDPLLLPRSKGSVLVRELPGSAVRDAMGPYPVFSCRDWSQLPDDLDDLPSELVSIALVTAPFGNWTPDLLSRCFPDRLERYKDHFVIDLSAPRTVSAHHERQAARALRRLEVECVDAPLSALDDWNRLYGGLVARHRISGIQAFSPASFSQQLSLRGCVAVRAVHAGETVSISLWLVENDVAYYHLAASSEQGYALEASYALVAFAIEHFAGEGLGWLSLGAGAGLRADPSDGLSRFKAGWATGTRPVYLCGRILMPGRYAELSHGQPTSAAGYFPAYRDPAAR